MNHRLESFQIASDLHIETGDTAPPALSLIKPVAKNLILAGDIGRILKPTQLKTFLEDVCKHFAYVLYIPGNHEYYKVSDTDSYSMEELLRDLHLLTREIPNLHILHRNSVVIGNVCVAGCTLWSMAVKHVPSFIVRVHDMSTSLYNRMHLEDLDYIEKMIEYCKIQKLKLLMVTHHCPSYHLLKKTKKQDRYVYLYASNLDRLFYSANIHTWVFGHTHYNVDTISRNGTRLVTNQKGKPRDEITDFSLSKVISV
jgi:predicted phosphodiesterase